MPLSIAIAQIPCKSPNHHSQLFSYICLNPKCLQHGNNMLCIYCMKQSHYEHKGEVMSLRQFVDGCGEGLGGGNGEGFGLGEMLVRAVGRCGTRGELGGVVGQMYKAVDSMRNGYKGKLDRVVNNQVKQIKQGVEKQLYKVSNSNNPQYQLNQLHKTSQTPSLTLPTSFPTSLLSFSPQSPYSQAFTLTTPFQAQHRQSKLMSSILAYPSLTSFTQSSQTFIKVTHLTPNWLGIGLSLNEHKYQQQSKHHITLLSNGWLNNRGFTIQHPEMRYQQNHTIRLRWDKIKKLVTFTNMSTKHQTAVKFEPEWNQQVYLCVTMFFKGDGVEIVQGCYQG